MRTTREAIGWTQDDLGARAGISRGMVARIEAATVNMSVDVMADTAEALGLELEITARLPFIAGRRQRDPVHALMIGYVQRRLEAAGWRTAREVEVVHGRSHGFIDLLAFDEATGTLFVIEIKTELDDVGRVERTLAWYERESWAAARRLGWRPRRVVSWLLVLATEETESRLRHNRESLGHAFPVRGSELLGPPPKGRGLAIIDPRNRRSAWLLRSRVDGRRTPAPYADYASFLAVARRPRPQGGR